MQGYFQIQAAEIKRLMWIAESLPRGRADTVWPTQHNRKPLTAAAKKSGFQAQPETQGAQL